MFFSFLFLFVSLSGSLSISLFFFFCLSFFLLFFFHLRKSTLKIEPLGQSGTPIIPTASKQGAKETRCGYLWPSVGVRAKLLTLTRSKFLPWISDWFKTKKDACCPQTTIYCVDKPLQTAQHAFPDLLRCVCLGLMTCLRRKKNPLDCLAKANLA